MENPLRDPESHWKKYGRNGQFFNKVVKVTPEINRSHAENGEFS